MGRVNLLQRAVERVAQHVGGTRVLALPLLRALAVVGGATWVALAPPDMPGWGGVALTVLVFFLYSVALGAALWLWPGTVLRLNAPVLVVDLSFALLLIHFTGARSTLFLALLLIAGVQSYYYGTWRGFLVAVGSGLAYLAVVWPTISEIELANMAIRLAMLVGTALGVGILADIETSERLKVSTLSAEALDRERFIRDILESLREGVVALDRQGCVRAWNHALAQRSGVPAREALGRPLHEVLPLVDRDTVLGHLGRLLAGAVEHFAVEGLEAETRDGARLVLNVKGSLLRQGGEPAGAVLLLEDVTDRVALERSARQAEKLAALGTLAAGLAHELNNPIGIMSSRVELMLLDADAQPLPGVVREDLQVLHRNVQRVARIAQGLLSFARPSPGEQGPVDVNQVVEDTLLLVEKDLVKHGIALRRRLAPGLPPVRGDANGLQQVVLNLLTNARDALGRGGEVVLETSTVPERPGALRLLVRDNGPGIPPDVLPRIFDPFFTTKGHGTGLGLSISHGIVRDHGGTLDVESAPGRGTTFVLTFPAVAAEGAQV
jgi:PAS domain S-box-containing protein